MYYLKNKHKNQGRAVQSVVSLTSSLVVKMLTVLVSTISNTQIFLLKNVSSFLNTKLLTFFQENISIYAIFGGQRFNDITNDIVSFEQLGPEYDATELHADCATFNGTILKPTSKQYVLPTLVRHNNPQNKIDIEQASTPHSTIIKNCTY